MRFDRGASLPELLWLEPAAGLGLHCSGLSATEDTIMHASKLATRGRGRPPRASTFGQLGHPILICSAGDDAGILSEEYNGRQTGGQSFRERLEACSCWPIEAIGTSGSHVVFGRVVWYVLKCANREDICSMLQASEARWPKISGQRRLGHNVTRFVLCWTRWATWPWYSRTSCISTQE